MKLNRKPFVWAAVLGILLAGSVGGAFAQEIRQEIQPKAGGEYVARLIAQGAAPGMATTLLNIDIDRFSTPEEQAEMLQAYRRGGQDALLEEMRDDRVGRMYRPGHLGVDLLYADSQPTPEGRRIVVIAERWRTFAELYGPSLLGDYPFIVAWFTLEEDGRGEGGLTSAAELYRANGTLAVDSLLRPGAIRLIDVRPRE